MKVKLILKEGVEAPKAATDGAAALDLVANIERPITLKPQASAQLVPTGVFLDMTETPGLCALLLPRSGLGHKQGLVLGNGVGLIDNDYQGELMVSALNRNAAFQAMGMGIAKVGAGADIVIEPGMRLAQLMFLNAATPEVSFEQVESFEASKRGAGGFGSTGTKRTKG